MHAVHYTTVQLNYYFVFPHVTTHSDTQIFVCEIQKFSAFTQGFKNHETWNAMRHRSRMPRDVECHEM